MQERAHPIQRRFRGFLPVVVDVETGGFDPRTDALLEIAVVLLDRDEIISADTAHELWDAGVTEAYVRSRGVEIEVVDDPRCVELMERFIADNPALWNEDIGE